MNDNTVRGERGFSLLELTVVLFILTLAIALIAPTFSRSFGQVRLKASARDIAALCRFARAQAIAYQDVLEVVFDRQTNSYWLRGADRIIGRLGGVDQASTVEDSDQSVQMRQARIRVLPSGVSLKSVLLATGPLQSDERGVIAFFPYGSSTGGEIDLSDEKGRVYRIVVDPSVGLVRINAAENA